MMDILRWVVAVLALIVVANIAFGQEQSLDDASLVEALEAEMALDRQQKTPQPSPNWGKWNRGPANPTTIQVQELQRVDPEQEQIEQAKTQSATTPIMPIQQQFPAAIPPVTEQPVYERSAPFMPGEVAVEEESLKNRMPTREELEHRGILKVENGGFSSDLWQGVDRHRAETLLERLQRTGVKSQAVRHLLQRALLTQAMPPMGKSEKNWLATRITTLHSLGYGEAGYVLLGDFRKAWLIEYPDLAQAWTEATLMAGHTEESCAFIRQHVLNVNELFWRRGLLVCQALEGNFKGLQLSLDLAATDDRSADPLLFSLLDGVMKKAESPRLRPNQRFDALHGVLYSYFPHLVTPDAILRLPDILLRRIVDDSSQPLTVRLQSAEKLVDTYTLPKDIDTLGNLYSQAEFSHEVLKSPLRYVKEQNDGSMARALLWQAAGAGELSSGRALILKALWERAEQDGLINLPASLTPNLRKIEAHPNLAWFSPYVVRSALRGGNAAVARDWWRVLQNNRGLSRELKKERTDLALAFSLLEGTLEQEALQNWWKSQEFPSSKDQLRVQRMLTLLEANEIPVAADIWLNMHNTFNDAELEQKGPGPLWLRVLGTSLEQNHVGEAILLLAEPLMSIHPTHMAPQGIANVVTGLRYLGLKDDASHLALEAVLNEGQLIF